MTMQTISSVRFTANREQTGYTGQIAVTGADGTSYLRLTGSALATLLAANKAAGGSVRGFSRTVALRDGTGSATIVDYVTEPMRFTVEILGQFADNPQNITLVGATVPTTDIAAFTAGVTVVPGRQRTTANTAVDVPDVND